MMNKETGTKPQAEAQSDTQPIDHAMFLNTQSPCNTQIRVANIRKNIQHEMENLGAINFRRN